MKKLIIRSLSIMCLTLFILNLMSFSFAAVSPITYAPVDEDVDTTALEKFGSNIVQVVTTVGISLSVIILIVIGIRYIMGSVEQKVEYKKTMVTYVIGAVLVFSTSAVVSIFYNIARGFHAEGGQTDAPSTIVDLIPQIPGAL